MEYKDSELDALIEEALRSQEMLPVPSTLHARVANQLKAQALIERERARFRASMAMMVVALLAIVVGGVVLVAFTHLRGVLVYGAPGAKGRFDYLVNNAFLSLTDYTGSYSLGISLLLALGTLLFIIIPLRERTRHH